MEGNQISPPSLSKRDIARVLFKRKWTIISLYGIILVVCGVYAFFWPPTYTASAKILVKNDRQESVLSADRDVLKTLSKTNVTESDLNTEIDLLTSHDVLKETVIQLHLDQMSEHWLVRLINIPANLFWSIYNNYHSQENSSSIDLAIKKLKNKFSVLPQKKSNIIEVYLDWSTRDGASQILDKIISVYLSHQLEKMKTPDTQSFFTDQVKKQKEILNNLEDEIAKVAEGSTVDSLSLKINLNIESIENLEREISNERANQNKFKAKIAELEDQLSNTPPMVLKSKTNSYNQWALGEMKIALLDLEKERSNLAKQYSPDNRLVQINSDKIENSKKTLQSEMENPIIETTMMKNNVVETLEPNLLMAKSEFAASQSYEKSLTEQIDDLKKQQSILNQQIRDLKTLSREHRIAEENYLTYQKQYEQSRIESAMNKYNFINVTLASSIGSSPRPTNPRVSRLALLAIFLGGMVSLGYGFLVEVLDHSIKSKLDALLHLGKPVLGVIPIDHGMPDPQLPAPWQLHSSTRMKFREMMRSISVQDSQFRRLLICGINETEGTSWVCRRLACAFSEAGQPTLLYSEGLSQSESSAETGQDQSGQLAHVSEPDFQVPEHWAPFRFGRLSDGFSEEPLEEQLTSTTNTVVTLVDCPPLQDSPFLLNFAKGNDRVLLVVEAERERREVVTQYLEGLEEKGLNVLGIVLNKQRQYVPTVLYRML